MRRLKPPDRSVPPLTRETVRLTTTGEVLTIDLGPGDVCRLNDGRYAIVDRATPGLFDRTVWVLDEVVLHDGELRRTGRQVRMRRSKERKVHLAKLVID